MTLEQLLQQLTSAPDQVDFGQAIAVIDANYTFTPTAFDNGAGEQRVCNAAGSNEGSCKILAFAKLQALTQEQTLACFGEYYRRDVLQHPDGEDHANIRQFMRSGPDGVHFAQMPLAARSGS